MKIKREDIERTFDRLSKTGDLDIIVAILQDAAAMVRDELLKKLSTFPVAEQTDLSAFAYRQGWLRGLEQVIAILDPARIRALEAAQQRLVQEIVPFIDEALP
jgi:hypothetical protein